MAKDRDGGAQVVPRRGLPRVVPRRGLPRVVSAEFLAGATSADKLPAPATAEVAFAGRSNVGKSSLLNALLGRKNLVRTSNTPGCTRQINVFSARLADGLAVDFVDLPGYGYARVAKSEARSWGPMLEGYLRSRVTLRAVCVLVDVRRGLEQEELALLDFLAAPSPVQRSLPLEIIVCATKIDKLPVSARKPALAELQRRSATRVCGVSGATGEGCDELWNRLRKAVAPLEGL